jgi:nucleoside phosphorylase
MDLNAPLFPLQEQQQRPILIQGAHEPELALIRDNLTGPVEVIVTSFRFWVGTIQISENVLFPVVISETGIGSALSAASTTVACLKFQPVAIINQGINI